MLFYWLIFFFVMLGAKLLLALATIYLLFPSNRQCSGCDAETLLLQPAAAAGLVSRLSFGRLQRRWCPACRWEGWSRCGPPSSAFVGSTAERTPARG